MMLPQYSTAVTVVECESEDGERGYYSYCPPGTTAIEKLSFNNSVPQTRQPDFIPMIYLVSDCPACDAYKRFFQEQDINFTEKDIENNEVLQNELRELTGELKVPTVIIGEQVLTDYKLEVLTTVMEELGFNLAGAETSR
jgi:glutaredoxin